MTDPGGRPRAWQPAAPGERRLFVAVPLSDEVRDEIAALVAALPPPADRPVRWVRFDGLHVTLRFLGHVEDARLPGVVRVVDAAAAETSPFTAVLAGAGAFPSPGSPRALWLGITEGVAPLDALAAMLNRLLEAEGWPREERPFRAHLTLARADGVRSGPKTARLLVAAAAGLSLPFPVDRLVLFESHTGGGPARYEPVHEATLGG